MLLIRKTSEVVGISYLLPCSIPFRIFLNLPDVLKDNPLTDRINCITTLRQLGTTTVAKAPYFHLFAKICKHIFGAHHSRVPLLLEQKTWFSRQVP